MTDEDKGMFREEAVKSHATDVKLGEMMIVVTSKLWIALLCIIVFLVGIVFWSLFGVIPDNVSGEGIVLNGEGNFVIEAKEDALVEQILIKEGDSIEKGQVIIRLKNPELELSLEEAYKTKALIIQQMNEYKDQQQLKTASQTKAILETIEANNYQIRVTKKELIFLKQQLEWQEDLNKEGLITLAQINDTQLKINDQYNSLREASVSIQEAKAKLLDLNKLLEMQSFNDKLQKIEQTIAEYQLKKKELEIKSPFSGTALDIPVSLHAVISRGERIFWAETAYPHEYRHLIFSYFKAGKEQRIKEGMLALVKLNNVDYKLYGELITVVEKVNLFPVTTQEINGVLGNKNLADTFTKNGIEAPIQVILRPIRDASNVSGYKWTSKDGPPFRIESGILGEVEVRIRNNRPIEYVFPVFRSLKEDAMIKRAVREDADG